MTGHACPWLTSLDEDVEAYVRSVAEDDESDSDLDGIVDLLAAHGIGTEGSEDIRADGRQPGPSSSIHDGNAAVIGC